MTTIEKVKELEDFVLEDNVPSIETAPMTIYYELANASNAVHYADRVGFVEAHFQAETEAIATMDQLLENGEYYIHLLYCFRSCSRALPMVTDPNQPDKVQIYTKTFEVLRPEISKLKHLMDFQESVIHTFCQNIEQLAKPDRRKQPVPSELFNTLIKLIDLLLKLDSLKDMKACLQNDFSFYKRAFQHVRAEMADAEEISAEVHNLQMFLGNPQHPKSLIFHNLKSAVKETRDYEDVLVDMMNQTVKHIEMEMFVTPGEKWRLLRVLPHIMLLLDGDAADKNSFNVFKSRKVSISPLQKLFKRFPVVPGSFRKPFVGSLHEGLFSVMHSVFGDMSIRVALILKRAPHWDEESMSSNWGLEPDAKVKRKYSLLHEWPQMRAESDKFCPKLVNVLNEVKARRPDVNDTAEAKKAFDVVKEGLLLCSKWTTAILEQSAWKYQYPASEEMLRAQNADLESPCIEYERAVRYNYSKEELSVLVDCVSVVKALNGLMMSAESALAPLIRLYAHYELQDFLQRKVITLLHRADKRKRPVKKTLLQLRTIGADWLAGVEPQPGDDYKQNRKEREANPTQFNARYLAPGATQLHFLRATVECLYDERAVGMQSGGIFGKKDFQGEEVTWLNDFWTSSFYYPYMLNLAGVVHEVTDLSALWYREFYLEMTKQVQFPIDLSLPWMLTEHVINNPVALTSHMVENILYAMDIYNDSAHRALHVLQQQFLYDEIEAEVNLCFDQLIYLMSENMYTYYKNLSASQLLETTYTVKLEGMKQRRFLTVAKRRNEVPMMQRHIQLLGRSIDFSYLVGQHVTLKIRKDLETSIARLEASDLTGSGGGGGVMEFESLMDIIQHTHYLLSQTLELDSFETFFDEMNESVSPTSFRTRASMHVLRMIITDLVPNFSYNTHTQRFVRSPKPMGKEVGKESMPKNLPDNLLYGAQCKAAYEFVNKAHRDFFGVPHVEALVRILGHTDLPLIIDESLNNIEQCLQDTLKPYSSALFELLPPCKLPKFMYKTGGCFAFFEEKLRGILEYEDVKPQVFQGFREIGNTLAFFHLLGSVLEAEQIVEANFSSPYLGVNPTNLGQFVARDVTPVMKAMDSFVRHAPSLPELAAPAVLGDFIHTDGPQCVQRSLGIYDRENCGLFTSVLHRISSMLDRVGLRQDWLGKPPKKNEVMEIEDTTEFYRLWSAMQFLFCVKEDPSSPSDEEEFGDGFAWAGCTIIHLLGQTQKFNLLDFSYHVQNVRNYELAASKDLIPEADRPAASASSFVGNVGAEMESKAAEFLDQAGLLRKLNSHLFSLLSIVHVAATPSFVFQPPADDSNLERSIHHTIISR